MARTITLNDREVGIILHSLFTSPDMRVREVASDINRRLVRESDNQTGVDNLPKSS